MESDSMQQFRMAFGIAICLIFSGYCQAWTHSTKMPNVITKTCLECASTYFRGRSVPYVETLAEQRSRELWEQEPFHHSAEIINRFLSLDKLEESPALHKHETLDGNHSGYEDLFWPLYQRKSRDRDLWNNPELQSPEQKERLRHFLIRVAYRGSDFCGWQRQPHNDKLPSVQEILEDWLEPLAERKKTLRVCGRTDAGVSAVGQVSRFRSAFNLTAGDVFEHLQNIPSKSVKVQQVIQVSRAFHPSFTATCRAYVYLIDCSGWDGDFDSKKLGRLNRIMQALEGKELDYIGLSYGRLKTQTSLCTLHHARACLVSVDKNTRAICIELVGNRFLRRMVRYLVEAAIRIVLVESCCSFSDDALLNLIQKKDRQLIGNPAPPNGLLFVGGRFEGM